MGGRSDRRRCMAGVNPTGDGATTDDRMEAARPYARSGEAWASGAALAYRPLARHLVDRCPIAVEGAQVIDVGAGTGIAGAELRRRGARVVVSVDLEADMLRAGDAAPHTAAVRAVVADVAALPFRAGAFDLAVAAFVLNHVTEPARVLREIARTVRSGGALVASVFSVSTTSGRSVVDEVAAGLGWRQPGWYVELHRRADAVGTIDRMLAAAHAAELRDAEAHEATVDLGLDRPEDVVRYRLSMPQLAPFVASLDTARREELMRAAADAVARSPLRATVVELVARVS